jgi:hypothetical protein
VPISAVAQVLGIDRDGLLEVQEVNDVGCVFCVDR